MFRGLRPPAWFVQRDIHILVRSFPSEWVQILRGTQTSQTDYMEPVETMTLVYTGEGLFVPAGGTVERYGLGQVEEDKPKILIHGHVDIQQGDYCSRSRLLPGGRGWTDPRWYQVLYEPNYWHANVSITLTNFGQGMRNR